MPIELIYLLYYAKIGSEEQITTFQKERQDFSYLKADTIRAIEALPQEGDPMDCFAAALLLAGMFEKTGDFRQDGLEVIAKLPQIAACVINHHASQIFI